MPYNDITKLPPSFKNLSDDEKKKAMSMLNGMLKKGMDEALAIKATLANIKKAKGGIDMAKKKKVVPKEEIKIPAVEEGKEEEDEDAISEEEEVEVGEIEIYAADFSEEAGSLVEKDNSWYVKIIQPGWGSSGYYSEEMLADSVAAFSKGTKMYVNHAAAGETSRKVEDLAGVFKTDAEYMAEGPDGAGLYTSVEVFDSFAPFLEEIAPYIGVSIFAKGQAKPGVAEGREGPMITKIDKALSVDFITEAGAGGKILQKLAEAKKENEALSTQLSEAKAENFCLKELKDNKLPEESKTIIIEQVVLKALDNDLTEVFKEALEAEVEKIEEKSKNDSKVKELGNIEESKPTNEQLEEKLKTMFANAFGLNEKAADIAAKGR